MTGCICGRIEASAQAPKNQIIGQHSKFCPFLFPLSLKVSVPFSAPFSTPFPSHSAIDAIKIQLYMSICITFFVHHLSKTTNTLSPHHDTCYMVLKAAVCIHLATSSRNMNIITFKLQPLFETIKVGFQMGDGDII